MKNKIFTKMVLVSALSANLVFATGIPVVDGAMNAQTMQHNLQQVAEWLKEANRWVETTQHYSSQLDHYAKEIAIQTGVRDVVSFLKDVKSVYDEADKLGTNLMELDFRKDSKSAWSDKVKQLMKQIYDYDYCANIVEDKEKNGCYTKRKIPIDEIILYEKAGEKMQDYAKNISKLKNKLAKSQDPKESADINNAIQAEIALMQVEKNQIDLQLKALETKRQIAEDITIENFKNSEESQKIKIDFNRKAW